MRRNKNTNICLCIKGMYRMKIMMLCFAAMFTLNACGGGEELTENKKPETEGQKPGSGNGNPGGTDNNGSHGTDNKGGVTTEASEQNTPEGWTAVKLPELPVITDKNTFNIKDYGASTSSDDNTGAIQKALDAVPSTGGKVLIPAGEWLCGPIRLKSKTILYLAANATLKQLPYGTYPPKTAGSKVYDNFISNGGNDVTDICVEGEDKNTSIIDGQGEPWWKNVEQEKADKVPDTDKVKRGAMIRFTKGQRFLVKNLKLQNAPGVNLTISQNGKAGHATIHDIIIREPSSTTKTGQQSHNTDGIAVWGPYVNIYNCDISNGDDNVVVDLDGQFVHVWNCTFGDGHGASIGSYTVNVHDILYENITFNGTESGFRLKSQRGRSGDVYNITCRNCTMTGARNPIYIECWYDKSTKPIPGQAVEEKKISTTPAFRDILLQNIKSTGTVYDTSAKQNFPIYIYGLPESYVKNVIFDNVQVEAGKRMFMAFCSGIKFINGCKITNTRNSSEYFSTEYKASYTGSFK